MCKIWKPYNWKTLNAVSRIRIGDVIQNPVYVTDNDKTRDLADKLDDALASRGLRIDHTHCCIGFVESSQPPLTLTSISLAVQSIESSRINSIDNIAKMIRSRIVVPACDELGLSFANCNTDWWFMIKNPTEMQRTNPHRHRGWNFIDTESEANYYGLNLDEVFSYLTISDGGRLDIGCYIEPYNL